MTGLESDQDGVLRGLFSGVLCYEMASHSSTFVPWIQAKFLVRVREEVSSLGLFIGTKPSLRWRTIK